MHIVHGTIFAGALGAEAAGLSSRAAQVKFARDTGESREIALP